ncbi:hypothetical protein [Agromyces sp. NPDC058126]|uniref:hypothetical protein n=1 Tax=Agromyces sp. NPDC058126 TaxID=3346350 RepID=UPI0036DB661F
MTASRPLAAASFTLLALLLTGCAAGAPAADAGSKGDAKSESAESAAPEAGQSKEADCAIVKTTLTELEGLSSVDTSDPAAALEAFKGAEQTVKETAAQVSDADVKAAADSAAAAMTAYVAYVDGMLADPANADVSAMGDHLTALTEGITELTVVCA